jgi:hypothetical protein
MISSAYQSDFVLWSEQQADALRRHAAGELDWVNLEDEIGSLGKRDKRDLRQRLASILVHLLLWHYDPNQRSRAAIDEHRSHIANLILESPSLSAYAATGLASAYRFATIDGAIRYPQLERLPEACPWTIGQVLSPDFLP